MLNQKLVACFGGTVIIGLALLFFTQRAHAVVRITNDYGGRIGEYVDKYQGLRSSGEMVIIDGLCASACTLALGMIPRDHLCVTPRAKLGFHQAYDQGYAKTGALVQVANRDSSESLFHSYPRQVRDWIFMHGGLPPPQKVLMLSGRALAHLVPICSQAMLQQ